MSKPDLIQARQPAPHTIRLTTSYGDVLASEELGDAEFASGLRRFYNRAMQRANAVVVLDGVTHTRNAFLEFVRAFNERAERAERLRYP